MASLSVPNPEITEVLDLRSGQHVAVNEAIGSHYGDVLRLRMDVKSAQKEETPIYVCALCNVPVSLLMHPQSELFFFRHLVEDGRCSAVTRGELSREEIDARKYNGAKESAPHIRMKNLVAASLRADPRFSNVEVESRWEGTLTGKWRTPDVRAVYHGEDGYGSTKIAFEIQLSTTYLDVIAERRLFYLEEGGLLFWIFAAFNGTDRRLTQDDVFYNNNQNAFIVSEETAALSVARGAFHLDCVWEEPVSLTATSGLKRKTVPFHELALKQEAQQAYYFDFHSAHRALQDSIERKKADALNELRTEFETFWLGRQSQSVEDIPTWVRLRTRVRNEGVPLPDYPGQLPIHLFDALYSVKHGRVFGWSYATLVQLAHWIVAQYKSDLQIFRIALHVYNRAKQIIAEDMTGNWRRKVVEYKRAIAAGEPSYEPDTKHDKVLAFFFPELFADAGQRRELK